MANSKEFQEQYPPPPLYYQLYTDANISAINGPFSNDKVHLVSLEPPIPPEGDQEYTCFGVKKKKFEPIKSLKELGLEELVEFDDDRLGTKVVLTAGSDCKHDLKKLNDSLLCNFVELLEKLTCENPDASSKLEEIKTILINFHHLLNVYRNHQARDSLIYMLKSQISKKKQQIQNLKSSFNRAVDFLDKTLT